MKLGIFNTYEVDQDPQSYQAQYMPMMLQYLQGLKWEVQTKVYDMVACKGPSSLTECDAWLITGSPQSAYDQDPWIQNLIETLNELHSLKKKIIGICFGHQLLAQAFGGKVEKAKVGWGLGVQKIQIIKKKPWMSPHAEELSLLFSHQDQVTRLPPGAEQLATSDYCPHQMFQLDDHILSLQGHPEFTKEYSQSRIQARKAILEPNFLQDRIESLNQTVRGDLMGQWIVNFLLG